MDNSWQPGSGELKKRIPENLHPWLFQVNHLTTLLKQHYPDHAFQKIEVNTLQPTTQTERDLLGVGDQAIVRRICHHLNGKPAIYGRVAIPTETFALMQRHLSELDDRNIGQILYTNPGVRRGKLYYREIDLTDPEFTDVKAVLQLDSAQTNGRVFARLAIFYWYGHPFVLQEFFVDNVFKKVAVPWRNQLGVYRMKEKCLDYVRLIRLHRPIPILLILWPVYWALWISSKGFPGWKLLIIFTLGTFLMRSAGDIINDVLDRNLDPFVARTKDRPLATKRVSVKSAVIFTMILCLLAFGLVLMLNPLTIGLAFIAIGLTIIYPLMKRIMGYPQLVLGMAYNWGVIMAFSAVQNTIPVIAWWLWGLTIIWTVAYDTLYALADRQYDIQAGLKSTAVTFGRYAENIVLILDGLFLVGLFLLGFYLGFAWWFVLFIVACVPCFIYQIRLTKGYEIKRCIRAFNHNHWVGLLLSVGVFLQGLRW